jgi:predicted nucleic acid-binding Zn ribbon protein
LSRIGNEIPRKRTATEKMEEIIERERERERERKRDTHTH